MAGRGRVRHGRILEWVRRGRQAERLGEASLENVGQRGTVDLLGDHLQDDEVRRGVPHRALREETGLQTTGDQFLGLPHLRGIGDDLCEDATGDVQVVLDPARHVQQRLDRDIRDLGVVGSEVGEEFGDGVVESDGPFLDHLHDDRSGERLGDASDAEVVLGRGGLPVGRVTLRSEVGALGRVPHSDPQSRCLELGSDGVDRAPRPW